jgi:hypothetical protein
MVDTPAPETDPAPAPEPEPVEPVADDVEMLPSGLVNVTIGGVVYRLHPPDMGTHKRLRLALEAVTDAIDDASYEAERVGAEVGRAIEAAAELSPAEQEALAPENMQLRRKAKAAARELVMVADDARVEWWQLVFELVSTDNAGRKAIPDTTPAWFADINLPGQLIAHWRSAPLARGR